MPSKQVSLDVSAFLDSPQARALEASRDDARAIVEIFVSACYDQLGKAPRFLDGHDVHEVLGHVMPGHFTATDARVPHVPAVLEAYVAHLEETQVVHQSFEIRRALEATLDEFLEVVRTGRSAHHHAPAPQEPFVHGAPKLGRNDPCSCGSGLKYKKCHGKGA
jgi:hypothetical protein